MSANETWFRHTSLARIVVVVHPAPKAETVLHQYLRLNFY
jgi:hypothetical protein